MLPASWLEPNGEVACGTVNLTSIGFALDWAARA